MEFRPLDPEAEVDRRRRRLPHWIQRGGTYFVTFRLGDSLARGKREELEAERRDWLRVKGLAWPLNLECLPEDLLIEYRSRFSERVEDLLDAGMGACVLKERECSAIVESSLRHFDGERYALDAYVVMPNHVHCVVCPISPWTLSKVLQSWKRHSAREINKLIGATGTSLWLDENFDHVVRSEGQLEHFRKYILENPKKAGLKTGDCRVGCGRGIGKS